MTLNNGLKQDIIPTRSFMTNDRHYCKEIVDRVSIDEYDNPKSFMTGSKLAASPRQLFLGKAYKNAIVYDVHDQINFMIGNDFHKGMEQIAGSKDLCEVRFKAIIHGMEVSIKIDLFKFDEELLIDWKSAKAMSKSYRKANIQRFGKERDSYTLQIAFGWKMLKVSGYKVSKAKLVILYKDWDKYTKMRDYNYPNKIVDDEWMKYDKSLFLKIKDNIRVAKSHINTNLNDLPECDDCDTWKKDKDVWVLMKKGGKSAMKNSTSSSEEEALQKKKVILSKKTAKKRKIEDEIIYVEHRPALPKKCLEFCNVSRFCNQFQEGYLHNEKYNLLVVDIKTNKKKIISLYGNNMLDALDYAGKIHKGCLIFPN